MSTDTRTQHLTITRPDDWHLHVRDGDALATVVPHTAAQFGRAVVMPNLKPPVTTAQQALAYRGECARHWGRRQANLSLAMALFTWATFFHARSRCRDFSRAVRSVGRSAWTGRSCSRSSSLDLQHRRNYGASIVAILEQFVCAKDHRLAPRSRVAWVRRAAAPTDARCVLRDNI